MAMSQSWFDDQRSIRIVLAEITYYDVLAASDKTIYLSNGGYITSDGITLFDPVLKGSINTSEKLSLDSDISMSVGDIAIHNVNGEKDSWLDPSKYIWSNKPITLYYGDPKIECANISTLKTTFSTIFSGIIDDIDSSDRSTINLKLRDKMELLNTPITENKLGTTGTWANGQTNQDTIKPLVLGEVFNTTPLLIDPATLTYMFNDGDSEQLIEVRDNGIPIYTAGGTATGAVVTASAGTFKLTSPAAGIITTSVQGVKNSLDLSTGTSTGTYGNSIAKLVGYIVRYLGRSTTRLSSSDIDLTNFSSFDSSNTQAVGLLVDDRINTLEVCRQLTSSIGAQLYFNRLGKLQLLKFGTPTSISSVTITESNILNNSFKLLQRIPVIAAVKIAYAKNYTIQSNIVTAIPQQHKDMLAEEWLTTTATDSTIASNYKLSTDPVAIETCLLASTSASAYATARLNMLKSQKTIYSFTGSSSLLTLELGQPIQLIHSRYNLYNSGAGVSGQIVSLNPDWTKGTIEIEVLI
jgi:hypothetical protein